jgi:hypothetical protein
MNVGVHKTVALVLALTKLHNYCIDADDNSDLTSTATNEWQTEVNGGVPLVATGDQSSSHDVIPEQLLDGGNHFVDIGGVTGRYNMLQRYNYISKNAGVPLPRDRLHSYIASIGVTRPATLLMR